MANITTVEARNRFSELINRAAFAKERLVLTRRGKKLVALVPIEDVNLLEALEDRIDLEEARLALAEAKRKGTVPWEKIKKELMALLRQLKAEGNKVVGYGASARGNTLLNYYGIGRDILDYIVDRNSLKQGLYSPGMHIPVFPVEKLLEDKPDYVLVLAWNFADEIIRQQQEYAQLGGKFILPIPETRIVAGSLVQQG